MLEEEQNAEVNIVNNVVAEGDDEGGPYDKVTRTIAASKEDVEKEDVEEVETIMINRHLTSKRELLDFFSKKIQDRFPSRNYLNPTGLTCGSFTFSG